MGSYINYSNRVEFLPKKWNAYSYQYSFDEICDHVIAQIVANKDIKYIQISNYLPEEKLGKINDLFYQRKDLVLRIYGFNAQHSTCDLSFLAQLSNVQRLSIDCIRFVENIEVLKGMSLIYLRLNVYDMIEYSFLKELSCNLQGLSIFHQAKRKANFDVQWLLRYSHLNELYLGRISQNIEALGQLKKLQRLTLRGVNLKSLAFLKESSVNHLAIHWCSMHDLSSLSGNHQIQSLALWRIMKLADLSFISTLHHLNTLRVIDLPNVTVFPDIEHTQMDQLSMENVKNIEDISKICEASNLRKLMIIGIPKVPMNQLSMLIANQNIQTLQISGAGTKQRAQEIASMISHYRQKQS